MMKKRVYLFERRLRSIDQLYEILKFLYKFDIQLWNNVYYKCSKLDTLSYLTDDDIHLNSY
jgi:hypothetical protein